MPPDEALTPEAMDAILKFQAIFEEPGFLFAEPWPSVEEIEKTGRGFPSDRALREIPCSFLRALTDHGVPLRIVNRKPGWSMAYVREPERLKTAELETLRGMLPDLFFGSRITGGLMADLFESGFWTRWLKRLRVLRG